MTPTLRAAYAESLHDHLDLASDVARDFGLHIPPRIVELRQRALDRAAELSRKLTGRPKWKAVAK